MQNTFINTIYIMGKSKKFDSISVAQARSIGCVGDYLGDEMVLFSKVEDMPFPSDPMRMDCLFLALCTSGQATYTVDTKERLVRANQMIIITEGQVVGDYMLSPDCKGVGLMVSNIYYREIIKDIHDLVSLFLFARTQPVVSLSKSECSVFINYHKMVAQRVHDEGNPFLPQICCSLLKAWLYELGRKIWEARVSSADKVQTRAETVFADFIQLVEIHFKSERRVSWYAEKLGISAKYLSEIVKTASRRTPNDWIDQYVTLEMRVLLRNSSMNIKEMTEYLHFPNQSFFGKYFKEHVGVSPSAYRKKKK